MDPVSHVGKAWGPGSRLTLVIFPRIGDLLPTPLPTLSHLLKLFLIQFSHYNCFLLIRSTMASMKGSSLNSALTASMASFLAS